MPVCRGLLSALRLCLDWFVAKVLRECPAFAEKVKSFATDVVVAH